MPPSTSTPLTTRSSSPSNLVKIGVGVISTRSCWCRTASLVVHRLTVPLACLRDGLLERLGQAINIGHIIPVDCPRLRFLLRRRLAIDDDADTLPIGEKFLFDACQVFPGYLDHFPVAAALYQGPRPQSNRKRYRRYNTQVDDEADNKHDGDNRAALRRCSLVHSYPQYQGGYTQHSDDGHDAFERAEARANKDLPLSCRSRRHKNFSRSPLSLTTSYCSNRQCALQ